MSDESAVAQTAVSEWDGTVQRAKLLADVPVADIRNISAENVHIIGRNEGTRWAGSRRNVKERGELSHALETDVNIFLAPN